MGPFPVRVTSPSPTCPGNLWLLRAPVYHHVCDASRVMTNIYNRLSHMLCTLPNSLFCHTIPFRNVFIKRNRIVSLNWSIHWKVPSFPLPSIRGLPRTLPIGCLLLHGHPPGQTRTIQWSGKISLLGSPLSPKYVAC